MQLEFSHTALSFRVIKPSPGLGGYATSYRSVFGGVGRRTISCVLCFALVNTYSSNQEETTLTEMLDVPRWYRFDVLFGRARYYACSCSVTSRVCGAPARLLPSNCFLLLNKVIASGGFIKHKSTSTCQTVMFHCMIYDMYAALHDLEF